METPSISVLPLGNSATETGSKSRLDELTELNLRPIPVVSAIESIEALDGCTQPVLMRADDGQIYVVKSTKNPFGTRVLVNELIASKLARALGLDTPEIALIKGGSGLGLPRGLHFGSRLYRRRNGFEWLPARLWGLVDNPSHLVGAYVLDTWIANCDTRQVVLVRKSGPRPFHLRLIDHSHCFGGPRWRLANIPPAFPSRLKFAYGNVSSWLDFEPWLTRIERIPPRAVARIADIVPTAWVRKGDRAALTGMLDGIEQRRQETRRIIAAYLDRGVHPFRSWRYGSSLFLVPLGFN